MTFPLRPEWSLALVLRVSYHILEPAPSILPKAPSVNAPCQRAQNQMYRAIFQYCGQPIPASQYLFLRCFRLYHKAPWYGFDMLHERSNPLSLRSVSESWRTFFQVPKEPVPAQSYLIGSTAINSTLLFWVPKLPASPGLVVLYLLLSRSRPMRPLWELLGYENPHLFPSFPQSQGCNSLW